eukprot:TRINITY_DN15165_c0_g1_i1.p1 TRINITY_DN15165_c0_g1~~TRINITY_DN15165_c0_g1_i1.p1  ORF type:complete len:1054 (+),score=153.67 TRINITY_DN15165_c0_g1_i1:54-3164(+)
MSDGLFQAWNEANPCTPVNLGDYIVEVNGVRGHPEKLARDFREGGMLNIKLRRCCPCQSNSDTHSKEALSGIASSAESCARQQGADVSPGAALAEASRRDVRGLGGERPVDSLVEAMSQIGDAVGDPSSCLGVFADTRDLNAIVSTDGSGDHAAESVHVSPSLAGTSVADVVLLDGFGGLESRPQKKPLSPKQMPHQAELARSKKAPSNHSSADDEYGITILKKEGVRLGIDVKKDKKRMKILDITPGLFQDWNENNSGTQVSKGDYIVEVNGVRGHPDELAKQLRHGEALDMRLRRYRSYQAHSDTRAREVSSGTFSPGRCFARQRGTDVSPCDAPTEASSSEAQKPGSENSNDPLVHGTLRNGKAVNDAPSSRSPVITQACVFDGSDNLEANSCEDAVEHVGTESAGVSCPVASGFVDGVSVLGSYDKPLTSKSTSRQAELAPPTKVQSKPSSKGAEYHITLVKTDGTKLGIDVRKGKKCMQILDITSGLFQDWNENNPENCVNKGDSLVAVNGVQGHPEKLARELRKNQVLTMKLWRPFQRVHDKEVVSVVSGQPTESQLAERESKNTTRDSQVCASAVQGSDTSACPVGYGGTALIPDRSARGKEKETTAAPETNYAVIIDRVGVSKIGLDVSRGGDSLVIEDVGEGLVSQWNLQNPRAEVMPGDRIVQVNAVCGTSDELANELKKDGVLSIQMQKACSFFDLSPQCTEEDSSFLVPPCSSHQTQDGRGTAFADNLDVDSSVQLPAMGSHTEWFALSPRRFSTSSSSEDPYELNSWHVEPLGQKESLDVVAEHNDERNNDNHDDALDDDATRASDKSILTTLKPKSAEARRPSISPTSKSSDSAFNGGDELFGDPTTPSIDPFDSINGYNRAQACCGLLLPRYLWTSCVDVNWDPSSNLQPINGVISVRRNTTMNHAVMRDALTEALCEAFEFPTTVSLALVRATQRPREGWCDFNFKICTDIQADSDRIRTGLELEARSNGSVRLFPSLVEELSSSTEPIPKRLQVHVFEPGQKNDDGFDGVRNRASAADV